MKTVLITGGSGMVGRRLTQMLKDKGYAVIWYSRERYVKAEIPRYKWDYRHGTLDEEALEKADYIIHLAGANLGDEPWTKRRKRTIIDSRVKTTELLIDALKVIGHKPKAFVSASAVGYYGVEVTKQVFTEDYILKGSDFLSLTCRLWESAADKFESELGVRTVKVRSGFVLSRKSEALRKMKLATNVGLGSRMGSGRQYMSWIHIDDLCRIYIQAIEDENMKGVYNAVAPHHTTNTRFMRRLARVMRRPFFMPFIPSFILRMVMGEAADMVLGGSRISSEKIRKAGFKFEYENVDKALRAAIKKTDNKGNK